MRETEKNILLEEKRFLGTDFYLIYFTSSGLVADERLNPHTRITSPLLSAHHANDIFTSIKQTYFDNLELKSQQNHDISNNNEF